LKDEAALQKALASLLPDERLVVDQRRDEFAVDGLVPGTVALPETVEEAAAVLAAAYDQEAAVIPWGNGTYIRLGNTPAAYDLALSLARLNRITEYEQDDLEVAVEAGVRLRDLQQHLSEHGQLLPIDPSGSGDETVGGILATNAGGPLRYAHGSPRDLVMGMKVLHADGRLTKTGGRVVKNVAGYDMAKLYVGSLGSLAVIVEATLRVVPLPMARETLVAFCPTFRDATDLALAADGLGLSLRALEVLDGGSAGALLRPAGVEAPPDGAALVTAVAGSPAAVERSLRDLEALCRDRGAGPAKRLADGADFWRALAERLRPGRNELLARASLLPTQVGPVSERLQAVASGTNLALEVISHACVGVVYSRWRAEGEADLMKQGATVARELTRATGELGGTFVVESCPPELKKDIDVWGEPREDFPLMRRVKEQWDPRGILNPGRFVGRL
jgi:glycolate oxidase FAD binding subunit